MKVEMEVLTDTLQHMTEVQENLAEIRAKLECRGFAHDRSKLLAVEFDGFCKTRPKFKLANYGSPEYRECVEEIRPSVEHHYKANRHHVAYHKCGFADMNLIDILEMLADWKAASRRSPNMSFEDSLPKAFEKCGIPPNMQQHIMATLKYLHWV